MLLVSVKLIVLWKNLIILKNQLFAIVKFEELLRVSVI